MRSSAPLITITALAAALSSTPVRAAADGQLSRQELVAPAAMTSTCGGLVSGGSTIPGDLLFYNVRNCQSASGLVGTQQSSALYLDPSPTASVTALAQAEAGMGWLRARSDFSGRNTALFPAAVATAGWEDLVTISSPGLAGQSGQISFNVHIQALLKALPSGNVAASVRLGAAGAFGTPGTQVLWGGQGQGGFPYDQTVNEQVALSVGFIFGTPFELGVFARTSANTASIASFDPLTGSFADVQGLNWQGISAVVLNGNPVPYSILSASGMNWTAPVPIPSPVPEPRSALLLLAGLGVLLRFRPRAA